MPASPGPVIDFAGNAKVYSDTFLRIALLLFAIIILPMIARMIRGRFQPNND